MKLAPLFRAALGAALCTALGSALAQGLPVVFGEPAKVEKSAPEPVLRLAPKAAGRQLGLAPVTDADVEKLRAENSRARAGAHVNFKRIAIGIDREAQVAAAAASARGALAWIPVAGGRAARLSATSPDAAAVRVALDLLGVPTDLEMVFFGSGQPGKLFGPYRVGDIADRSVPWWSPLAPGDTLTVEFFDPRPAAGGANPRIANVSHLFTNPVNGLAKTLSDIGSAGSCNVDIQCSSLRTSTAFQNAASSVAQMVFNDTQFAYLCTGTLLNDTDTTTQKPWLLSANHCFDSDSTRKTTSQLQSIASTLTTLWFFEAASCGSTTPNPNWQQMGGGAAYVYNNYPSDALLLRLNNPPPAGAFYTGWDANPVSVGGSDIDIHHPQGDLKKVSQGNVVGFAQWDNTTPVNSYIENLWSTGTTEGGSSGSPLLTFNGSQYVVRGTLRGGDADCSNRSGTDFFSRFDQVYPAISQYLNAPASVTPLANVTSLWWVPSESGWGLNLIHHGTTNIVFGTWYTYGQDGKRTWLVMPEARWTSPSTFSGTLYQATGPAFNGPFDPNQVILVAVGTGRFTLTDANNATWNWTSNGLSGSKSVRRFAF
jgi:lysyl endopeptidase